MSYLGETMADGCAYVWAPHLVQSKWTHCQTIGRVIKVRWDTAIVAYPDMERFINYLPHLYSKLLSKLMNWMKYTWGCPNKPYMWYIDNIQVKFWEFPKCFLGFVCNWKLYYILAPMLGKVSIDLSLGSEIC